MHIRKMLGRIVWVIPALGNGKLLCEIASAQGPGCTWWVMQNEGDVHCVPQSDLMLRENNSNHPSFTERQMEVKVVN